MIMEKRDLYDENKELTGKTIYKNEEIPEGYFILMVVAFIENNEGLFLIHKSCKLSIKTTGFLFIPFVSNSISILFTSSSISSMKFENVESYALYLSTTFLKLLIPVFLLAIINGNCL